MKGWLSIGWEANWRSFQYFNLYRLVVGGAFLLSILFPHDWNVGFNFLPRPGMLALVGGYLLAVGAGWSASRYWPHRFNTQLTAQVLADVMMASGLLHIAGGVASGLSVLLLISLVGASLVGRGRLVLLYAAMATLAVLIVQLKMVLAGRGDDASIVQAGFISAGFFATAILARLLGQRVMANEELARRRGEKLANELLISQRLFERMPGGLLVLRRDGLIERSNPRARAMLHLLEAGQAPLATCHPALAAGFEQWQHGGPERVELADGRDELTVRFEKTASTDGEALVFLEDTARIKAEAQQLKLAALGRLTASIAHEIRNPLSAIGHAGELLREERRGDMQDRLLRILSDNVGRLDRIVQTVLDVGRQTRAQPEPVALKDFLPAFGEQLRDTESLAPAVLFIDAADAMLCFDRAHLHQVLWNLVSNALRHASRQPGAVRVQVRPGASGEAVELHVIDDGPGIPEASRGQIFEPFFTTHAKGTGLGLFIARDLCVANGARLELAPAATGEGAHFILTGRAGACR